MRCPNNECGYVGYGHNGICPKCKEKMLPDIPLYQKPPAKPSTEALVIHYIIQFFARLAEGTLFFAFSYGVLWVFVFSYNELCTEVPDWTPIDFNSDIMTYVKIGLFLVILGITYKKRWRKHWV